jgi:hypothetical protein
MYQLAFQPPRRGAVRGCTLNFAFHVRPRLTRRYSCDGESACKPCCSFSWGEGE